MACVVVESSEVVGSKLTPSQPRRVLCSHCEKMLSPISESKVIQVSFLSFQRKLDQNERPFCYNKYVSVVFVYFIGLNLPQIVIALSLSKNKDQSRNVCHLLEYVLMRIMALASEGQSINGSYVRRKNQSIKFM